MDICVHRMSILSIVCLLAVLVVGRTQAVKAVVPQDFVSQLPGFPLILPGTRIDNGSPTLADIDGDGLPEIIVGGADGIVYAISHTGQLLWQFHTDAALYAAGATRFTATSINSAPAVADIDGDGKPEIVVSVGDVFSKNENGGVVALRSDGTLVPGWPQLGVDRGGPNGSPDGLPDGIHSSPTIADVDGDGKPEIIYGGFDQNVYVKHADGSNLPGWPQFVRDTVWSSPAVADLRGDGVKEIIIGIDAHADPYYGDLNGGYVKVYYADGSQVPGWPQYEDDAVQSSPAVGDLLGDDQREVVVGSSGYYGNGKYLTAYRPDGSILWRAPTSASVGGSPAIGDITGDGHLDVVVTADDRRVYAWDGKTGTPLPHYPVTPLSIYGAEGTGGLVLADYDGDGVNDIFAAVGGQVAVIHGQDGVQLTSSTNPPGSKPVYSTGFTYDNTPALGDLNGDGKLELVTGAGNNGPSQGLVSAWSLPSSSGIASWPMFRHDPAHSGVYTQPQLVASPAQLGGVLLKGTRTNVTVAITSASGPPLKWTATTNDPNHILTLTSAGGTTPGTLSVTLSAPSTPGTYQASITLQAPGVLPVTIPVTIYSTTQVHKVYIPLVSR